jgi:hypothetical protein
VGEHADFGLRQRRITLDPVDERRAARRCRKEPLEHDQRGTLLRDRLERLERLGIWERERSTHTRARLQRVEEFRRANDHRRL